MKYLVDANVLSEPTKPKPAEQVLDWLSANRRHLAVDPIIVGELRIGILALPAGRKRTSLDHWFDVLTKTIICIPWDAMVGRRWAKLVVDLRRKGQNMPIIDCMIAATALEHGLKIATRNTRDFEKAGAKVVDPFA